MEKKLVIVCINLQFFYILSKKSQINQAIFVKYKNTYIVFLYISFLFIPLILEIAIYSMFLYFKVFFLINLIFIVKIILLISLR